MGGSLLVAVTEALTILREQTLRRWTMCSMEGLVDLTIWRLYWRICWYSLSICLIESIGPLRELVSSPLLLHDALHQLLVLLVYLDLLLFHAPPVQRLHVVRAARRHVVARNAAL